MFSFWVCSFVYPLYVPCNVTQSLSSSEKTETEQDLRVKVEAMLGEAKEVLQDVLLSEVRSPNICIFLGHLSQSGDLLLWAGFCCGALCVNILFFYWANL